MAQLPINGNAKIMVLMVFWVPTVTVCVAITEAWRDNLIEHPVMGDAGTNKKNVLK